MAPDVVNMEDVNYLNTKEAGSNEACNKASNEATADNEEFFDATPVIASQLLTPFRYQLESL